MVIVSVFYCTVITLLAPLYPKAGGGCDITDDNGRWVVWRGALEGRQEALKHIQLVSMQVYKVLLSRLAVVCALNCTMVG